MKLNKIGTNVIAALILGSTSILSASVEVKTISGNEPFVVAYYGQVNSNGTVRTNRVEGYMKSNGTYVDSYYRS